jgi:hypothetical protein
MNSPLVTQILGRVTLGPSEEFNEEFEILGEPEHALSKKLCAFWHECRGRGGMMMNQDIPCRELASLMGALSVVEPECDRTEFRVRLASSESVTRFGRDSSGSLISELSLPLNTWYRNDAATVLETHSPLIGRMRVRQASQVVLEMEVVVLPIWSPDKTTEWLLIAGFQKR